MYYHNPTPQWGETIKISLLSNLFERAHFKFDIRQCSASTLFFCANFKGKSPQVLSFAFLKLVQSDGTVIPDKEILLNCYKPMEKASSQAAYLKRGFDLAQFCKLS